MRVEWMGGPDDGKAMEVPEHCRTIRTPVIDRVPTFMVEEGEDPLVTSSALQTREFYIVDLGITEVYDDHVERRIKRVIDYYGLGRP